MSILAIGREGAALLAELHGRCFAEGWSVAIMESVFSGVERGLVWSEGEDPAGFLIYRIAADEAEVITFGVLPAFRGQGIGRRLLAEGLARMGTEGAAACFLEVAEDNAPARALYAAAGFRAVGRRPNYYLEAGRRIDALVLKRDLTP